MKFAKELDENAIPEWKDKYFDYKGAKKKLKAVGRAVRNADRTSPMARKTPFGNTTSLRDAPVYSFLNSGRGLNVTGGRDDNDQHPLRTRSEAPTPQWRVNNNNDPPARARPIAAPHERSPLRTQTGEDTAPKLVRYGSIIGSPPSGNSPLPELAPQMTQASLLELPDPALDPVRHSDDQLSIVPSRPHSPKDPSPDSGDPIKPRPQPARTASTLPAGGSSKPPPSISRYGSFLVPKRTLSVPDAQRPAFLQRVFSIAGGPTLQRSSSSHHAQTNDIALEAYREIDFRQAEFLIFLDKQLAKIELFYEMKEKESTERLEVLRAQLHVLRNRRLEEIVAAEQRRKHTRPHASNGALSFLHENLPLSNGSADQTRGEGITADENTLQPDPDGVHHHRWTSVTSQVENALDKVRTGHVGKTSKAMEELGTPSDTHLDPDNRDYVRRHQNMVPPYRTAKRKLKTALQEYYRGLELLKSYALLNHTAFRKINKKFDKTVNVPSGSTMRYMSEKVNRAHFVNSDLIDAQLQAIEDLYARYFERGNRKVAVGKLRGKTLKLGDYTGSLCRAGFYLGAGLALGIQGVVYGCIDLYDKDPLFRVQSSYLLQLYAGYFLFLLLTGFFCLDARIFSRAKVNYQFVFEFDSRHVLDWRQLSEIPSVFTFLLGLTMFLNFAVRAGGSAMYIYWPVILIGVSVILMFLPPPLFYWNSRSWFLYSMWRLLLAGWYPVEFRDFFLGDMFCSETYAMGNIELFFCLYARHWNEPPVCNSSHSRLLGFFSTLPGIWRAFQCIRRYYDTRNWFPHLANCLKYICTILMYMSLSLFRIDKNDHFFAFFIVAASINSVYCSFWDIFMDWSLGNSGAKHRFLRNTLAFKRRAWIYYIAMVLDPILRFNWIFYAIFANDAQHSSIISFAVATSEVCRRGIWTIFRVENEHCTNVSRNRVVRDVELPYERASDETLSVSHFDGTATGEDGTAVPAADEENTVGTAHSTATDQQPSAQTPSSASFLRQRRQATLDSAESPVAQVLRRVGTTVATAHSQDYEKKRRTAQSVREEIQESDDEEDDDETAEAEDLARRGR